MATILMEKIVFDTLARNGLKKTESLRLEVEVI